MTMGRMLGFRVVGRKIENVAPAVPCVRPSVTSKKERDHTGSLVFFELNRESLRAAGEACHFKDKETAGEACRVAQPRAERSEGRRLSAAKKHE